jgi:hypothetical protein
MKTRRRNPLFSILALSAVAGLLLWAKLRLVANIPRSVYADPERRESEAKRGGESGPSDLPPDQGLGERRGADGVVRDDGSSVAERQGD